MTYLTTHLLGAIRRHFLRARRDSLIAARSKAQETVDDKANTFRTISERAAEPLNEEWLAAKRRVADLDAEIRIVDAALEPPLTLRDEIAMRAPHQLLISSYRAEGGTVANSTRFLAEAALAYADEFLHQRSQRA